MSLACFAPVTAQAGPPLDDPAVAAVAAGLACACFVGGELKIDTTKKLSDKSCACPYAARVLADVSRSVGGMVARTPSERQQIALKLESAFLTISPDYERMFVYDARSYRWFLENVRCTCEGCKATVYFSNCQLACTPAVIYKRRARVFLALGFSTDEIINFYLAEHNATHPEREQISREWLLPKKRTKRAWLVPALLIFGAIIGLGFMLAGVVRRTRDAEHDAATAAKAAPVDGAGTLSADERSRVLDALDDLDV